MHFFFSKHQLLREKLALVARIGKLVYRAYQLIIYHNKSLLQFISRLRPGFSLSWENFRLIPADVIIGGGYDEIFEWASVAIALFAPEQLDRSRVGCKCNNWRRYIFMKETRVMTLHLQFA